MSTRTHTYVIFGVNIDPKEFEGGLDDLYGIVEPFEDDTTQTPKPFSEISAVFDGMSGEFVIVGFIFARSDDTGHLDQVAQMPYISFEQRDEAQDRIRAKLAERGMDLAPEARPVWLAFTLWH